MSSVAATDLTAFRAETRAWLEANCPVEMRRSPGEDDICWGGRKFQFQSEAQRLWLQRMAERGWTVPSWPREYGGGGLSPDEAKVLTDEMRALNCRPPLTSGRAGPCASIWWRAPIMATQRSHPRRVGWS